MDNICVVFVCDKNYMNQFDKTYNSLINKGKYTGDVTLIIGDDLDETIVREAYKHVNVIRFNNFNFNDDFMEMFNNLDRDAMWKDKLFQYHKIHMFDRYFKKWDYIFYIDCGVNICEPIQPIIDAREKNTLLAHSDAYPSYKWKLKVQFEKCATDSQRNVLSKLNDNFDLSLDYFQTTIMLFDTSLIHYFTKKNILDLAIEYPISCTNDQGIIALYFTNVENKWKQLPLHNTDKSLYYYDYLKRNESKYIMYKK